MPKKDKLPPPPDSKRSAGAVGAGSKLTKFERARDWAANLEADPLEARCHEELFAWALRAVGLRQDGSDPSDVPAGSSEDPTAAERDVPKDLEKNATKNRVVPEKEKVAPPPPLTEAALWEALWEFVGLSAAYLDSQSRELEGAAPAPFFQVDDQLNHRRLADAVAALTTPTDSDGDLETLIHWGEICGVLLEHRGAKSSPPSRALAAQLSECFFIGAAYSFEHLMAAAEALVTQVQYRDPLDETLTITPNWITELKGRKNAAAALLARCEDLGRSGRTRTAQHILFENQTDLNSLLLKWIVRPTMSPSVERTMSFLFGPAKLSEHTISTITDLIRKDVASQTGTVEWFTATAKQVVPFGSEGTPDNLPTEWPEQVRWMVQRLTPKQWEERHTEAGRRSALNSAGLLLSHLPSLKKESNPMRSLKRAVEKQEMDQKSKSFLSKLRFISVSFTIDQSIGLVVRQNTQLAIDLFRRLSAQHPDGNLLFSPFSISAALEMTFAGATDATKMQFLKALSVTFDHADIFDALTRRLTANPSGLDGGRLDIANRLFGQTGVSLNPAFLSLLENGFDALLGQVDFANEMPGAVRIINEWVARKTNGMLPQMLQPGDLPSDTRLALANALYFEGLWRSPFDPKATALATFNLDTSQTVQVPMMAMTSGPVTVPYLKGCDFALVELPFQCQVAMDILLPDAVDGLPQLMGRLTPDNLQAWHRRMRRKMAWQPVNVSIPRFSIDSRPNIVSGLQALGLTVPFSLRGTSSDIDGQHAPSIGAMIHEAVLHVNEAGTRAAPVTPIAAKRAAAGSLQKAPGFVANHPFLVLLRDIPTGSLLLVGQVTNPST